MTERSEGRIYTFLSCSYCPEPPRWEVEEEETAEIMYACHYHKYTAFS